MGCPWQWKYDENFMFGNSRKVRACVRGIETAAV